MEFLVVALMFVGIMGLALYGGVRLLIFAVRRPERRDDPVPIAQVVPGDHSTIRSGQHQEPAGVRVLAFAIGGALIGGVVFVIAAIHDFMTGWGEWGTKGRLLRLRGKAHLPEVEPGDGWSDDAAPAVDDVSDAERRVLAEAWLISARMEHASVAAFAQLGLHLAALGAPADLAERTHQAALDEIRHARRCFAFARAFGGQAWTAGPIAALGRDGGGAVDRVRLAIGSLVDGCLNEGIAADVAANGARGARDPVVRDTLQMIAADEERHAELAWSVLAWCVDTGGEAVRAAVAARAARLTDELAPRAPDFPGLSRERLVAHGLFDQDTIGRIAVRRIDLVRRRASELVAPSLPRAA
jgi:hypothetical protein